MGKRKGEMERERGGEERGRDMERYEEMWIEREFILLLM